MHIFLEKDVKKSLQRRGLLPRTPVGLRRMGAPPPDPRVVTPAYCYNLVKFISSAKCGSLPSKKNKLCIFQLFCCYFSLQTP